MKNKLVSDMLYQIADLLDIKGDNFFKTRAYRIAAHTIEVLDEDIETIVKDNRLQSIPGIGIAISKKVKEIIETGKLEYFENLKKDIPDSLLNLIELPGLGPKKVASLFKNLRITNIEELKKVCLEGKLRNLEGFGEITEKNILRGIQLKERTFGRFLLNVAYTDGYNFLDYLKKFNKIKKVDIAGSLRRKKDTIGDLDILVASDNAENVMDYFIRYPEVQRVLMRGSTKSSVLLKDDLQVDLRVVKNESYGAALQYFTGSKDHNVKIRGIAIKNGFRLNEYGLFNKDSGKFIKGKNEEEIYKKLGLEFIVPELRENRGEIEVASKNKLPNLLDVNDIKGDLHIHSLWSDGSNSISEIAEFSKKIGYKYIGIADHSQSLKIAHGLTKERLIKKKREIDNINKKYSDFKVLFGTECDIKSDGSLDYSDKILKKFDYVYIGIHSAFKMSGKEMEDRIIKAMENEYTDILAHPTGRLIGRREPFNINFERIIDTANDTNTIFEINSFPDRLDLDDLNIKKSRDKNIDFVIGTDSHNTSHFDFMRYGVYTARRGWLSKNNVINTFSLKKLLNKLER